MQRVRSALETWTSHIEAMCSKGSVPCSSNLLHARHFCNKEMAVLVGVLDEYTPIQFITRVM